MCKEVCLYNKYLIYGQENVFWTCCALSWYWSTFYWMHFQHESHKVKDRIKPSPTAVLKLDWTDGMDEGCKLPSGQMSGNALLVEPEQYRLVLNRWIQFLTHNLSERGFCQLCLLLPSLSTSSLPRCPIISVTHEMLLVAVLRATSYTRLATNTHLASQTFLQLARLQLDSAPT